MVGKDKRLARETTSMNERKAGRKIGILLFVLVLVLSTVSVIPSIADQGQSTFSLNGLTAGRITWSGFAGQTVWSNNSGDGNETMEIYLHVVSSDNISEIRIWIGDSTNGEYDIPASHISVQFSSDGTTWGSNTISFSDGGSNITIDKPHWSESYGCYGGNPFAGIGLTGKDASIYCRFKLEIPGSAEPTSYYSFESTSWKVYIGSNQEIVPPFFDASLPAVGSNFLLKWGITTGIKGFVPPVTKDINGDGIHEIFMAGEKYGVPMVGRIICIDGATGTILWSKEYHEYSEYNKYVDIHTPMIIVDLNKDGNYELVHSAGARTIAMYANNGTEFWNVSVRSGWHQLSYIDNGNEVFVYVTDHNDVPGNARISKLYGRNGTLIKQVPHFTSCYGGITIGDINNDGKYEILVSDRSGAAGGMGLRCYDEDLNLLWNEDDVFCSSHCAMIMDINGDGNLEVIVGHQAGSGSGLYVLSGTGSHIPGKCSLNVGLTIHCQMAIGDIDGDGHQEVLDGYNSRPNVFDLTTWSKEFTFPYNVSEPPDIANVIEDDSPEIILCKGTVTRIYKFVNGNYCLVDNITMDTMSSVTQDVDHDGYNELIFNGENQMRVYETRARTSTPEPRTEIPYGGHRKTNNGLYYPPPYYSSQFNLHETLSFGGKISVETITEDHIPPTISNVIVYVSTPIDTQSPFGWENITCTVTDNIGVDCVRMIITDPYNEISNISMIKRIGSNDYYYGTSYQQHGNYTYYIWAKDTSNNGNHSRNYHISLAPNWDVNKDGKCTVLDQTLISNHYGEIGVPGWIREDVDNNGRIQVLDLILVSNHFDETWWV